MLSLIEVELKKHRHCLRAAHRPDPGSAHAGEGFPERQLQVFLISLKAGGVGLNLTEADTVIHYDPWWNPATETRPLTVRIASGRRSRYSSIS